MNDNDKKWYVLRVRPRHEKVVAERLSENYEIFLPLLKKINKWSDRVKCIEIPLFSGYLFIKTAINMRYYILEEQGVSAFVQFGNKPAIIRDEEIQTILLMLKNSESLKVENGFKFTQGDAVRITRGVFAGIEGKVLKNKNQIRLYISIEQLGKIISVEIDKNSLQKINNI
ncbi:MAG: UpxY family transcription antiterminator [Candidatus Marinimicrobia bacterium]|nr:UpxY family transcription antiterminator [Candidatus Neomarinimicrobiota bacterium]